MVQQHEVLFLFVHPLYYLTNNLSNHYLTTYIFATHYLLIHPSIYLQHTLASCIVNSGVQQAASFH